eukprot:5755632-Ditylum_brightwellii.AAC.1
MPDSKKDDNVIEGYDTHVILSDAKGDKEQGDVTMTSAEQESKNAKSTTVLAKNAIISSVHATKEDFGIAMNASNEQCSSKEDNDD